MIYEPYLLVWVFLHMHSYTPIDRCWWIDPPSPPGNYWNYSGNGKMSSDYQDCQCGSLHYPHNSNLIFSLINNIIILIHLNKKSKTIYHKRGRSLLTRSMISWTSSNECGFICTNSYRLNSFAYESMMLTSSVSEEYFLIFD